MSTKAQPTTLHPAHHQPTHSTTIRTEDVTASATSRHNSTDSSPLNSPASLASVTPSKSIAPSYVQPKALSEPYAVRGEVLSTPDIWEAMSCIDEAEQEEDEAADCLQDAGVVSWDRMDVLMASYEYGGCRAC